MISPIPITKLRFKSCYLDLRKSIQPGQVPGLSFKAKEFHPYSRFQPLDKYDVSKKNNPPKILSVKFSNAAIAFKFEFTMSRITNNPRIFMKLLTFVLALSFVSLVHADSIKQFEQSKNVACNLLSQEVNSHTTLRLYECPLEGTTSYLVRDLNGKIRSKTCENGIEDSFNSYGFSYMVRSALGEWSLKCSK